MGKKTVSTNIKEGLKMDDQTVRNLAKFVDDQKKTVKSRRNSRQEGKNRKIIGIFGE